MSGTFTAIYEGTEDGWWVATYPEIPGAISQCRTLEEARYMLKDVIKELGAARRSQADQELEGKDAVREPLEL